ncbi:hypothetical protein lerEdw1_008830 [Lerista edwardsae]|nr:hypothetical protein lerEdw1_008830 [Lerista edwardsae]
MAAQLGEEIVGGSCNSVASPSPPMSNRMAIFITHYTFTAQAETILGAELPISYIFLATFEDEMEGEMMVSFFLPPIQGAGTAIGELPPYFMARAARLSGAEPDDEEYQEFEEMLEHAETAQAVAEGEVEVDGWMVVATLPKLRATTDPGVERPMKKDC